MRREETITRTAGTYEAYKAHGAYKAHVAHGAHRAHKAYRAHTPHTPHTPQALLTLLLLFLFTAGASAQIKIGGNVYGGGNKGNVKGNTKVTVRAGDLHNVFGGARMADVGGNALVNIDGENASDSMVINKVFGGNDIAGTIGSNAAVKKSYKDTLTYEVENNIDKTWDTFVHITTKTETVDGKVRESDDAVKTYIGQLFAGGNGEYTYPETKNADELYEVKTADGTAVVATSETPFVKPDLKKTYLEVLGGSIVYAYGGGNNATVTDATVICVDNPSNVVNSILGPDPEYPDDPTKQTELLTTARFKDMGINTGLSYPSSDAFQIGRFFGGNNLAAMAIRPTWDLRSGKIRNVYSGGNHGNMTSPDGLLLEIPTTSSIIIDNLFGGCRMADVMPTVNGVYKPVDNLPGYKFPAELSARVLVRGGDVNNVYGGNDVTGTVYGGNAVGIYTTIRGNVYGGGNGSYPYTDQLKYKGNDVYADLYYGDFMAEKGYTSSIDALNAFRPNAEQVSIRLSGTDARHPTIIKGSVFLGGNSATLATTKSPPLVELKIGSHVIADKVFLGNNGENMVQEDILTHYANKYELGDQTITGFSSLDLTDKDLFAKYMEGVVMHLKPRIIFDKISNGDPADYEDYTSYIGSFYCGGNVGSMAIPGVNNYAVSRGVNIFTKFVGGCNNADVPEREGLNAAYEGGVLGAEDERGDAAGEYYTDSGAEDGNIKNRLEIDLENLTITPLRWDDDKTMLVWNTNKWFVYGPVEEGTTLTAGETYYTSEDGYGEFEATGTEVATGSNYYEYVNDFVNVGRDPDDHDIRLLDGNVYGGCYESGHVNGNVVININDDVLKRDEIFGTEREDGRAVSGVEIEDQADDVMAVALTVFGAGYGEDTEIWGSATVNLNKGYAFQIFGGGEMGVVGKKKEVTKEVTDEETHETTIVTTEEYVYDPRYSTTVNMHGASTVESSDEMLDDLAESEYLYGAGSEGDVCGDAYVYLGNGRIYDAFGGASNADILGHTEVFIGGDGSYTTDGSGVKHFTPKGFPWIRDNIYAGNDFGGTIWGKKNYRDITARRPSFTSGSGSGEEIATGTFVAYIQGRVDSIFGGGYGSYDYKSDEFNDYVYTYIDEEEEAIPVGKRLGDAKEGFTYPHITNNSLVFFQPANNNKNYVGVMFGGSQGFPSDVDMNNTMQAEAYVLVDDTQTDNAERYSTTDIYGGGAYAGVGNPGAVGAGRTAVDLFAGRFNNVYGGSNREGMIGFSTVNVPAGSTVHVNALFGGGKGYSEEEIGENSSLTTRFCDHYVTLINYQSADALVDDAIYGGNQNCRVAADTYLNIEAPVFQPSGYHATIYGAGYGANTVSARTNIFMNNGSAAYKVFGGGRDGNAFNFPSLSSWLAEQYRYVGEDPVEKVTAYRSYLDTFGDFLQSYLDGMQAIDPTFRVLPTNIGTYPVNGSYDGSYTNDIITNPDYHNTNVHIMQGANVSGYAYGGGYGADAVVGGTTYIELKGGNVSRDIYGGGEGGPVYDEHAVKTFTAGTNVYIEGGQVRNVYGGGYLGHVGKHTKAGENNTVVDADISDSYRNDIYGEANVVIGRLDGTSFTDGIPAILRNAYGGGEGGSVYGTSNLTLNNGYIGYRYTVPEGSATGSYVEELTDQKPNDFELGGNIFGGGYVINSYVDIANVNLYGGTVRGSVYGGGELGPIGRGTMRAGAPVNEGLRNGEATIYKAGQTHVKMFNGLVKRNVFGGGRGKDSWGGDGTMFMDQALVAQLDMKPKGYVFGQTDVCIHGGEIGTEAGMAYGYGNVFGGGDEGSVYSAYENSDGSLGIGLKDGVRYEGLYQGYYYKSDDGATYLKHNVADEGETPKYERYFTEDCHVLVEPWLQVTAAGGISYDADGDGENETYAQGDYVPTAYLNTLGKKDLSTGQWPAAWADVDAGHSETVGDKTTYKERGVIIHNAVFAGGNVGTGSQNYANTNTVFGNATATVHDVFNRDLITIGTGHTGGLYGDGNLTFVDGYRELNITNYGTDYDNIEKEISYEDYVLLPPREAAYYELKYKCVKECTDNEKTTYSPGSTMPQDELLVLFEGNTDIISGGKLNSEYWVENGVVSRYAGRIMNTIQRADFCGVFGSRMVMRGAQDRVPEIVDFTNYTINRVREVSLNKKVSGGLKHGNYFGIYNIVNYLGALTSDVRMEDTRTTDSQKSDYAADGKTFAQWKQLHRNDGMRNNGSCHNQVALASGVYLELTTELSKGTDVREKDWGPITGIIELDLLNVQPGIGGGFVYAKNEHGVPSASGNRSTTLTKLNENAATKWDYDYTTADSTKVAWETSGNFIHSTQTIIDDCYNVSNKYAGADAVPAHYWFIKGQVYVYDQYISAYTGAPNAYSESVEIPLTINTTSNSKMTLMDVKPNLYAYYSTSGSRLTTDQKLVIRDVTYQLNDPISYWDYQLLSKSEQSLFVPETYVNCVSVKVDNDDTVYAPGTYVMSEKDFETFSANSHTYTDDEGEPILDGDRQVATTEWVFRKSNNMSHEEGFLLTYNVNNPNVWNKWYTPASGESRIVIDSETGTQTGGKITATAYEAMAANDQSGYIDGPTYRPTSSGLYGQREYKEGDIITEAEHTTYQTAYSGMTAAQQAALPPQAAFQRAYITTEYVETLNKDNVEQHLQQGAKLAQIQYSAAQWTALSGKVAEALVCTNTVQLSETEFITAGDLMTAAEKTSLINGINSSITALDGITSADQTIETLTAAQKTALGTEGLKTLTTLIAAKKGLTENIVPAYYCVTKETLGAAYDPEETYYYGGDYYQEGTNVRAIEAWSSMSPVDRERFEFNYDALDLLIDPEYGGTVGKKYQYDGLEYSEENKPNMIYSLSKSVDYTATYTGSSALTYTDAKDAEQTIAVGATDLTREQFEAIPNEQRHYASFSVTPAADDPADTEYDVYIVNSTFIHGETPYAAGTKVTSIEALTDTEKEYYLDKFTFKKSDLQNQAGTNTFYYCREEYVVGENGEGKPVTDLTDATNTYAVGDTVEVGTLIDDDTYTTLANKQKDFIIHGISPKETSTLFVSRNSDIYNLSKEKIITVVYQYDYAESDGSGMHLTPVSERHVVNIHVQFKSGMPFVDDISQPGTVIPGTSVTLKAPTVTPGAYEVLGGGWELFEREDDADSHVNGIEYSPSSDPLYWYQDGFHIAYYAKTYLGKTYSNHVPVSVANYHDLKRIMDDKVNHLHVDYDRTRLKRDSKVYINDYSGDKDGADLLKDLFDLSLLTTSDVNTDGGLITTVKDDPEHPDSPFKGHSLLNNSTAELTMSDGTKIVRGVRGGTNLEFIMRTDIDHSGKPWSPIGTDDDCFKGTLHGDGHTVKGLTQSMFYNLCGDVYNLGVTGSFTSAGVVDRGNGYVENCWIATTATSGFASGSSAVKPVFGKPTDDAFKQVVNCYYPEAPQVPVDPEEPDGPQTTLSPYYADGPATAMPSRAFYNGTVAYDLNGFYLYKRYNDKKVNSGLEYSYWKPGEDEPQTAHYAKNESLCSSGYNGLKYVEDRYADGDFVYADGNIPSYDDERLYVKSVTDPVTGTTKQVNEYYPIWPDDYLFFGQRLTYGYSTQSHQDVPTAVTKDGGRVSTANTSNRVYRAPAYYRSGVMDVAHFNPGVFLAQKERLTTAQTEAGQKPRTAYPGMTAIDFAGHNDNTWHLGTVSAGFADGSPAFYPPLLDDDGLTGIINCDETPNLLVYAPAETADNGYANKATYDVLNTYFVDPEYSTYYVDDKYRRVTDASEATVNGHLVNSSLTAPYDHLLVDKRDFNAPIAYTFATDKRMWYQRKPDDYVSRTTGWEGVSVPFTAELVTTNQKGEITHFYDGSDRSKNDTGTKTGHEYWLREFTAIKDGDDDVATATMTYPSGSSSDVTKTVTNTFLWDYYYQALEGHNRKDLNNDTYQQYYSDKREYVRYPLLAKAKPYVIGFPGSTYYEFDLSGNFAASTTATPNPAKIGRQTITFASATGAAISVSDSERGGVTKGGYTFLTNYLNDEIEAGSNAFVMAADGSSYEKVPAADAETEVAPTAVTAFRPYFVAAGGGSSRQKTRSIVFTNSGDELDEADEPGSSQEAEKPGTLVVSSSYHKIAVKSKLKKTTNVRIVTLSGISVATFALEPGETVETRVNTAGVYIVHDIDSRYTKKIAVR